MLIKNKFFEVMSSIKTKSMKNLLFILFIIPLFVLSCTSTISNTDRYNACMSLISSADKNLQVIDSICHVYGPGQSEKLNEYMQGIRNALTMVEHNINEMSDSKEKTALKEHYTTLATKSGYLTATIGRPPLKADKQQ
jgi:hypothetical protein